MMVNPATISTKYLNGLDIFIILPDPLPFAFCELEFYYCC